MAENDIDINLDDDIRRARQVLQRKGKRSAPKAGKELDPEKALSRPKQEDDAALGSDPPADESENETIEISDDTLIDAEFLVERAEQSESEAPAQRENEPSKSPQKLEQKQQLEADKAGPAYQDISSQSSPAQADQADIPSFDLADDMMAKQRERTAARRKGPGIKHQGSPALAVRTWPRPQGPAGEKVIRRIVARDIARFISLDQKT